ncbi:MAG: Gfo/Idh/MocA family oxidoreductase [Gammaproteobacteria bacterium]|nr:Gfo/Idh/MocA family oxidoreductase [Gammaproteobacteria bacterium]
MSAAPVRVGCLGMGWWSDVLADAIGRSDTIEIAKCFTRSEDKRAAFAEKYGCVAVDSYEDMLSDDSIEAIINTTPNSVHLETVRQAAEHGKHVFLDKPIANTVAEGKAIAAVSEEAGIILSVGYQRRRESQFRWIQEQIGAGRFGKLVQAECNISRDRLGKIDLSSWRYQSSGMPGGVMLQIGIHYTDVLEMLMGPVKRVNGMSARLVLPGDNPDVANVTFEHENGALSNLTASYASASEYYMMNIYGKEASAYYDLFGGLRFLERGSTDSNPVPFEKNDTIREELDEFAACVRGEAEPEVGGLGATRSLAVILAGVKSAREGRTVDVDEVMNSPDA